MRRFGLVIIHTIELFVPLDRIGHNQLFGGWIRLRNNNNDDDLLAASWVSGNHSLNYIEITGGGVAKGHENRFKVKQMTVFVSYFFATVSSQRSVGMRAWGWWLNGLYWMKLNKRRMGIDLFVGQSSAGMGRWWSCLRCLWPFMSFGERGDERRGFHDTKWPKEVSVSFVFPWVKTEAQSIQTLGHCLPDGVCLFV